jgi:hypothetical protein
MLSCCLALMDVIMTIGSKFEPLIRLMGSRPKRHARGRRAGYVLVSSAQPRHK